MRYISKMGDNADRSGDRKADRKNRTYVKSIFYALLAGLTINILLGLILDFGSLLEAFRATPFHVFALPFLLVFAVYLVDSARYRLVFRKFNIRISLRDSFINNLTGYFFCSITPGSLGGQPFQVLHFSRLGIDPTIASNVVFSRLIEGNLVQLFIVAVFFHKGIGMMRSLGKGAFLLSAGMTATIVMTIVLVLSFLNPHLLGVLALRLEASRAGKLIARLLRDPRWAEKISVWSEELGKGFKILWRHNMGTMLIDILAAGLTLVIWSLALYFPLTALTGSPAPFPEFILSYSLCGLISLFIPTPGGSGSVEAAFLLVLGTLTGKPAETMSAILIWRFGSYYLHLLLGGLVYFFLPTPRDVYRQDEQGMARRVRKARTGRQTRTGR